MPRQPERGARFLTLASLRWVIRHRAYTPWYLVRYWRFARLKLSHPDVITRGMVFLDRGAEIEVRRGYGRLVLGKWLHVGANSAIRCHEGTLRIGDKCVFARRDSVNCYLDIEIGTSVLFADDVYLSDFDHRSERVDLPIKDQGIVMSRVRIGDGAWLGTKVTVARGVVVGAGAVIGANSVVTRDVPPFAVAVGAPARVVRTRR